MPSKRDELHKIVERNYLGHKSEVYDYCGGHLNENHLWKPPEEETFQGWQNGRKPPIVMKEAVRLPSGKRERQAEEDQKVSDMSTAMTDFTLGIQGTIGPVRLPPITQSPRVVKVLTGGNSVVTKDLFTETPRRSAVSRDKAKKMCEEEMNGDASTKLRKSVREDRILVEEYPANQHFLPVTQYVDKMDVETRKQQLIIESVDKTLEKDQFKYDETVPDDTIQPCTNLFLLEPTRTLQFQALRNFRDRVVREKDTCEMALMSGGKSVEHLESKLRKKLTALGHASHGPNFHRLQIYGSVFEDLITESTTFGPLLHEIKAQYDRYVSYLLDSAPPQHRLLSEQMTQLVASGTSQPGAVEEAQAELEDLEGRVQAAIEKHHSLLHTLGNEKVQLEVVSKEATQLSYQATKPSIAPEKPPPHTESEEVEELRADCWERLDAIAELHNKLNKDFVPIAICMHLDQCCQEAEIDLQKLEQEKESLASNVKHLESELTNMLQGWDMPSKVEKQIWEYITGAQVVHDGEVQHGSHKQTKSIVDPESDTDNDRWNWYIS